MPVILFSSKLKLLDISSQFKTLVLGLKDLTAKVMILLKMCPKCKRNNVTIFKVKS